MDSSKRPRRPPRRLQNFVWIEGYVYSRPIFKCFTFRQGVTPRWSAAFALYCYGLGSRHYSYFRIEAQNKLAVLVKRLEPGQRVTVKGRLFQTRWLNLGGTWNNIVSVRADEIGLCPPGKEGRKDRIKGLKLVSTPPESLDWFEIGLPCMMNSDWSSDPPTPSPDLAGEGEGVEQGP